MITISSFNFLGQSRKIRYALMLGVCSLALVSCQSSQTLRLKGEKDLEFGEWRPFAKIKNNENAQDFCALRSIPPEIPALGAEKVWQVLCGVFPPVVGKVISRSINVADNRANTDAWLAGLLEKGVWKEHALKRFDCTKMENESAVKEIRVGEKQAKSVIKICKIKTNQSTGDDEENKYKIILFSVKFEDKLYIGYIPYDSDFKNHIEKKFINKNNSSIIDAIIVKRIIPIISITSEKNKIKEIHWSDEEKFLFKENLDKWKEGLEKAGAQHIDRNYAGAAAAYQVANDKFIKHQGVNDPARVEVLLQLAMNLSNEGNIPAATDAFSEAKKLLWADKYTYLSDDYLLPLKEKQYILQHISNIFLFHKPDSAKSGVDIDYKFDKNIKFVVDSAPEIINLYQCYISNKMGNNDKCNNKIYRPVVCPNIAEGNIYYNDTMVIGISSDKNPKKEEAEACENITPVEKGNINKPLGANLHNTASIDGEKDNHKNENRQPIKISCENKIENNNILDIIKTIGYDRNYYHAIYAISEMYLLLSKIYLVSNCDDSAKNARNLSLEYYNILPDNLKPTKISQNNIDYIDNMRNNNRSKSIRDTAFSLRILSNINNNDNSLSYIKAEMIFLAAKARSAIAAGAVRGESAASLLEKAGLYVKNSAGIEANKLKYNFDIERFHRGISENSLDIYMDYLFQRLNNINYPDKDQIFAEMLMISQMSKSGIMHYCRGALPDNMNIINYNNLKILCDDIANVYDDLRPIPQHKKENNDNRIEYNKNQKSCEDNKEACDKIFKNLIDKDSIIRSMKNANDNLIIFVPTKHRLYVIAFFGNGDYYVFYNEINIDYLEKITNELQGLLIHEKSNYQKIKKDLNDLYNRIFLESKELISSAPTDLTTGRNLVNTINTHKLNQLNVVTSGVLSKIPLSIYVNNSEEGKFLFEEYAFAYSPSVSWFIKTREKERNEKYKENEDSYTIFHSPVLPTEDEKKEYFKDGRCAGDLNTDFTIGNEVDPKVVASSISKLFKNKMEYSGEKFTNQSMKTAMDKRNYGGYVHLFTHGYTNGAFKCVLYPTVLVSKGKGDNGASFLMNDTDVMKMDMKNAIVVLQACNTAQGVLYGKEDGGIDGLVRGFLFSGARGVLGGMWELGVSSSSKMVQMYFENVKNKGMSPARALQQAQIAELAEEKEKPKRKDDKIGVEHNLTYHIGGYILFSSEM